MTLCIAAISYEDSGKKATSGKANIVVCSDNRIEGAVGSSDYGDKFDRITSGVWAMFANEISKAREFAVTCREVMTKARPLQGDDLFERLNEASAAHKRKLCEHKAQLEFGISYDRLLKEGEHALPESVRVRFFNDLERLDYGCEMLIFGFVKDKPQIFLIDRMGEVSQEDSFAAIGTGAAVAEGNLYVRNQNIIDSLELTLYHLYESAMLAYIARAPGVGRTVSYSVFMQSGGGFVSKYVTDKGIQYLERQRAEFAPKRIMKLDKPVRGWLGEYTWLRPPKKEKGDES